MYGHHLTPCKLHSVYTVCLPNRNPIAEIAPSEGVVSVPLEVEVDHVFSVSFDV